MVQTRLLRWSDPSPGCFGEIAPDPSKALADEDRVVLRELVIPHGNFASDPSPPNNRMSLTAPPPEAHATTLRQMDMQLRYMRDFHGLKIKRSSMDVL